MFGMDAVRVFSSRGYDVVPADLPELDITDGDSLRRCFEDVSPEIVVNAAAFTDVDGAESRKEEALRINGEGVAALAELCLEKGVFIVQISTDYVFPGRKKEGYLPSDETGPALGAYGESKLAGERALRSALAADHYLICRTQWLYGRNGKNFVDTIARLAREKDRIEVVDDQWGVPTWTDDLALQMCWLLENGKRGAAHAVGGGGPITWFQFAKEIVRLVGAGCEVVPIGSDRLKRPARRPELGWLRNDIVPNEVIRDWKESLSLYLKEERSA